MGATGYIIKSSNGGRGGEARKEVVVSAADGTIDVEKVETFDKVDFRIKTTYDGYETIIVGSKASGGYFKAAHIKFNEENRRYRLVCILNGGSYTSVAKDFAIYYIKFGWRTGGANADHWYIEEYSRQGNGAYVSLEQIALNEYNVLIHTPTGYAYANIGILKEDKEPDVTIDHFNNNTTRYTPTGTIIETETPAWKNGALIDTNPEDLEIRNGLLQIADRSSIDGLGYVILRPDKTFAEQVNKTNTIYEVRYNFDLNGAEVTIPANCVLQFTGGSISNGALDLNNCKIQADTAIFNSISLVDNCIFTQDIKPEWFGAKGDGVTDSTNAWASAIDFAKKIKLEGAAFRNQFGQGVRIVADKHNRYLLTSNITIDERISVVGGFTFLYNGSKTPYLGVINLEGDIYYQEYSFNVENVSSWKRDFSDGIMTCGISLGNPNATTSGLGINILKDINISGFFNAIQLYGDAGTDYVYQHTFENISSTYCVNCFYLHSENRSWHNSNTFKGITLNAPSSGWTLPTAPFPCVVFYFYSDGNYTPNSLTFENVYLEGYPRSTYYSLLFKIQSSTNTSADPSGWQFRSIRVENTNTELHAECDCLALRNTTVDMLYHNKNFKIQLKETTISEGDGTLNYNGINFFETRQSYNAIHKLIIDGNAIIRDGFNGSKYIQTDSRFPLTKLTSTEIKAVNETSFLNNFTGYYCCAIKIAPQQRIYICRNEVFLLLFTLFNENEQRILFEDQTDLLISSGTLRVIPYSGKDYVGLQDWNAYGMYVFTNNSANTYYLVPQINGSLEIKSNQSIELKDFAVPAKVDSNYPTIRTIGQGFYNTSNNTPTWWNGSKWICADGFEAGLYRRGDTSLRPTLTSTDAGFQYFDTDLGKPIYWTGLKWVDATGADLQ